MKVQKKILYICFWLTAHCSLYSTDLGPLSSIYGGIKSIVGTVGSKSFWDGVGRSFGASPSGYIVNFEVCNDSHQTVNVGLKGIASFMGAYFPSAKGVYNKQTLHSLMQNTGTTASKASYNDEEFYFDLYMSTKSNPDDSPIYKQTFTQLGIKNDPKIYYYHAYTNRTLSKGEWKHGVGVEMLGYKNPGGQGEEAGNVNVTSQLSNLVLYNTSQNDFNVTLTYNGKNYAVTVEKDSYNTLTVPTEKSSDGTATPKFSLRPNTITYNYTTSSSSSSSSGSKVVRLASEGFEGYTYIVESFQDSGENVNIGIQGLTPGHYDQAVTSRVRDITPCSASFWYESVAQAGKDASSASVDLPGQVWVVYQGQDSSVKSKVEAGKAVSWDLVRPLIRQGDQKVMFLYVATSSDKDAEAFVDGFIGGTVGASVLKNYNDQLAKQFAQSTSSVSGSNLSLDDSNSDKGSDKETAAEMQQNIKALIGDLDVDAGRMVDTTTNVSGYLLGADVFSPKGVGAGNYYYTLSPSIIDLNSLTQLVLSYVDTSKLPGATATGSPSSAADKDASTSEKTTTSSTTSAEATVEAEVKTWLKDYVANPSTVKALVTAYLQKYGKSSIVDASGKLNQFGQYRVDAIVSGKVSLEFPPMKLSTVTNHYVFDFGKNKPTGMPTAIAISS